MNQWWCEHSWFEVRRWAEWSETVTSTEMPDWAQWYAEQQCSICGLTQTLPVAGPPIIDNHPSSIITIFERSLK